VSLLFRKRSTRSGGERSALAALAASSRFAMPGWSENTPTQAEIAELGKLTPECGRASPSSASVSLRLFATFSWRVESLAVSFQVDLVKQWKDLLIEELLHGYDSLFESSCRTWRKRPLQCPLQLRAYYC
jgi:hypothetical protein